MPIDKTYFVKRSADKMSAWLYVYGQNVCRQIVFGPNVMLPQIYWSC